MSIPINREVFHSQDPYLPNDFENLRVALLRLNESTQDQKWGTFFSTLAHNLKNRTDALLQTVERELTTQTLFTDQQQVLQRKKSLLATELLFLLQEFPYLHNDR